MSSSFAVDVLDDVSVVLLLDEVLELWLVLDADLLLDEVVEVVIELLEAVLAVSFFEKSPDKNMVIINKIRLADVSAIEYILYFGFGDFLIKYQIPIMPMMISSDSAFFTMLFPFSFISYFAF